MFADAVFEGIGVVDFSAMEVELVVDEEVVEDIRDLDDVESEEVETFLGDVVEELELDNVDVLREVDTLVEADVVVVEAVETAVDIRGVAGKIFVLAVDSEHCDTLQFINPSFQQTPNVFSSRSYGSWSRTRYIVLDSR
ncbi:hypothetical protein L3Y34_002151 [Caenorhabditis briggsae]|uniref:Uncharacterized protein n=1 Tax=Caenorhabditis briggsae TaxID=6238 RepID=A0AAE9DEN7_CAEBR|nr:hypothetical protein L3Y34_002151 [Caenorhabditis briggsae]